MGYDNISIYHMLSRINQQTVLLPALQRKFVWSNDQILHLMDSILRGYPIGIFFLWKIKKSQVNEKGYPFYKFIGNFHERDYQNEPVSLPLLCDGPEDSIWAVLDGQQRLASLYVALQGTMRRKIPWKHRTSDDAYPETELYFNVCWDGFEELAEEEPLPGKEKCFQFLRQEEARQDPKWVLVKSLLSSSWDPNPVIKAQPWGTRTAARNHLTQLRSRLVDEPILHYYELESSSYDEILDIFVRINSGGTVLSKSDLLFSTMVSCWDGARKEMDALEKAINKIGRGFRFSSDFMMRACLYLIDAPLGMKVENFNRTNVAEIRLQWPKIRTAIKGAVTLLSDFGFSQENIRSYIAAIPIAYYFFHNESVDARSRQELRRYFILAQLNRIFGASTNTALSRIRKVQQAHLTGGFELSSLQNIEFAGGQQLRCTPEELDGFFNWENTSYHFMLLSLLYPSLKLDQKQFHIDHMHPRSAFEGHKLDGLLLPDGTEITAQRKAEWKHRCNTLSNLQLLEGGENESKKDLPLAQWLDADENRGAAKYLPRNCPYSLANCEQFWEARKALMLAELKRQLL